MPIHHSIGDVSIGVGRRLHVSVGTFRKTDSFISAWSPSLMYAAEVWEAV